MRWLTGKPVSSALVVHIRTASTHSRPLQLLSHGGTHGAASAKVLRGMRFSALAGNLFPGRSGALRRRRPRSNSSSASATGIRPHEGFEVGPVVGLDSQMLHEVTGFPARAGYRAAPSDPSPLRCGMPR